MKLLETDGDRIEYVLMLLRGLNVNDNNQVTLSLHEYNEIIVLLESAANILRGDYR